MRTIVSKSIVGLPFILLLLLGLSSCTGKKAGSKLYISEVLVDNKTNYMDDYGERNAWVEIFNKSFGSTDLAGDMIKVSSTPGDTAVYRIPKGDVLTLIKPRQHAIFFADGDMNRGTFHTNFKLYPDKDNWIALYDMTGNLLDQIVVRAGLLKADQSYARKTDASSVWEVKDGTGDRYVTPNSNNQTQDKNPKMRKFQEHDAVGVGMSISAMTVVFVALILLYISFRIIGKISINMHNRNVRKAAGTSKNAAVGKQTVQTTTGDEIAAIVLALHEMQNDYHDVEETVLTINRPKSSYSPWGSKILTLREMPSRIFRK